MLSDVILKARYEKARKEGRKEGREEGRAALLSLDIREIQKLKDDFDRNHRAEEIKSTQHRGPSGNGNHDGDDS